MKKTIAILLLASLLLTACSGGETAPEPASTPTAAPTQAPVPAPTPALTPEPTPTPTPSPTPEPENYTALMGCWAGRTYTNEYMGAVYRQPETWSHLDAELLASLGSMAAGQLPDEDNARTAIESWQSGNARYVLYAASPEGNDSCSAVVEELTGACTEEEYVDASAPGLETALTAMGASDLVMKQGTVAFAGAEHACLRVSCKYNGMAMYELLVVQKEGDYIVCYTFTTTGKDQTDSLLDAWTALPEA